VSRAGLSRDVSAARTTTILLVDDDGAWRAVIERWLEAEGMRGIGLGRGEWVTSAIDTHRPDALLLDIHLPGVDGLQVLEAVRVRWPDLPVVIMTAFGGRETGELARQCGATAYLEKPFRMGDLMAELERLTAGGAQRPKGGTASGDDPARSVG
jgi:two-component system, NtrC family, nitrogen regulation response regulator GlnG